MGYGFRFGTATVGQEVGIARSTRYGNQSRRFGTVTKINGHGHIFVTTDSGEEMRFDKHGDSYKKDYGPSLYSAEYLRKDIADDLRQKQQRAAANALQTALKGNYAHTGHYWNTVSSIAVLKELLNEMEKLAD
mgnify:CR=1 FL=1|jgi:hypothetical protein